MEQENGGEKKQSRPGWLIWIYLMPVYVLLAYPLSRWVRSINSGDVALTAEQKAAFATNEAVPVEAAPAAPANPVIQTGETRRQSGMVLPLPREEETKKPSAAKPSKPAPQGGLAEREGGTFKWKVFGATRGVITKAIGSLLDKPAVVRAILNNSAVIDAFVGRPTVKPLLNDQKALLDFAAKDQRVNDFLNNPVVQQAMSNQAVVDAFAESGMMNALLSSPAVSSLASNPAGIQQVLNQNPQLAALLQNKTVMDAIARNPLIAPLGVALQAIPSLPQTGTKTD